MTMALEPTEDYRVTDAPPPAPMQNSALTPIATKEQGGRRQLSCPVANKEMVVLEFLDSVQ